MPRLQTFAKSVASRSLRHVGNPSLETAEATASILSMLGAVRLPYQQVRFQYLLTLCTRCGCLRFHVIAPFALLGCARSA